MRSLRGFDPFDLPALPDVPASELFAHRIPGSVVTLALLLGRASFRGEVRDALRDRRRR